jgi:hypothetical protein
VISWAQIIHGTAAYVAVAVASGARLDGSKTAGEYGMQRWGFATRRVT